MQFTYRELEQITGLPYSTLAQWKQRGLIDQDGDGAGTKSDPGTFTDEMVHRVLWLADLAKIGVPLSTALHLWEEAMTNHHEVLVLTADGPQWLSLEDKRPSYKDAPAALVISFRHFIKKTEVKLKSFQRVTKFRRKINLLTVEDEACAVH